MRSAVAEVRAGYRAMIDGWKLDKAGSLTARAMDSAIERRLAGEDDHYPDRVWFLDADAPEVGKYIARALDEGYSAVLVSADGQEHILTEQAPAA
jgi:hypothetical protein